MHMAKFNRLRIGADDEGAGKYGRAVQKRKRDAKTARNRGGTTSMDSELHQTRDKREDRRYAKTPCGGSRGRSSSRFRPSAPAQPTPQNFVPFIAKNAHSLPPPDQSAFVFNAKRAEEGLAKGRKEEIFNVCGSVSQSSCEPAPPFPNPLCPLWLKTFPRRACGFAPFPPPNSLHLCASQNCPCRDGTKKREPRNGPPRRWSGRLDLNQRSLAPQASTLPS